MAGLAVGIVIASILATFYVADLRLDDQETDAVDQHLRSSDLLGSVLLEMSALQSYYDSVSSRPEDHELPLITSFDPASSLQLMEGLLAEHEALHRRFPKDDTTREQAIAERFATVAAAVRTELPLSWSDRDRATWRLVNFDLQTVLTQARLTHSEAFTEASSRIGSMRHTIRLGLGVALLAGGLASAFLLYRLVRILRNVQRSEESTKVTLRSVMDSIPDPVVFVDRDSEVRLYNQSFRTSFAEGDPTGVDVSSYLGEPLSLDPARPHGHVRLNRMLHRVDGRSFPAEIAVAVVRDEHEDVILGKVAVVTDLSISRARQRRLQRALAEARTASEAKSRFVANTSHELRTPLTAIIGFTEILIESGSDPVQLEFLGHVIRNADHLLRLVDDVLDISRIEAGEMTPTYSEVDTGTLLRQVVKDLQGMVKDRPIEVVTKIPSRTAPLITDRVKLRQILMNLVSNAFKFTEEGTVTVSLAANAEGVPHRIEVVDTGIGIAPEMMEAIREPFRQAEDASSRRFGGTGLGIPISVGLAEVLDYRFGIRSQQDVGSTFTLWLQPPGDDPLDAAQAEADARDDEAHDGSPWLLATQAAATRDG